MILDIAGKDLPSNNAAIDALIASKHEFYLSGSRYFGCEKPNSDWDFIATRTDDLEDFLDAQGFGDDVLAYSSHRDNITVAVVQADNVQVQLVRDADTKRRVRDSIKQFNREYHQFAEGGARTRLWNDWLAIFERTTRADAEAERSEFWW